MHKHSIRLAFSLLLSSVVLFLTLAAVQPPRRTRQDFPSSPQPEICARLSAAEPHQLGLTTAATTTVLCDPDPPTPQAEWYDTCDIHRMEITGMGMGNETTAINPQTVALTDPAKVGWLWVQVAGRYSNTTHTPESVTFTTDTPESLILNQPASNTSEGYTFETELPSAGQITAFVNNPGDTFKTPRGLVLYAKREMEGRWTSIGKTMNSFAYHNPHAEVFTFPRLTRITDLYITAVVINNQADSNSLILEARAGERLTQTVPIAGPADGWLLNIVPLTLTNVPANTDQVTLTLHSPTDNDDSPVWVGANVSYRCGADLAVTKTVNDLTPDAEEIITYTVTVANNGPEDATGVQVRDKLPEGITFITYTATAGTAYSSTTGLWDVGNLFDEASAVLSITARVNDCTNGKTIPNMARILNITPTDPISGNNEVNREINVTQNKPCYVYLPIIFKDYLPLPVCDIRYEDGFSDSTSGWITGSYPKASYSYISPTSSSDEYKIESKIYDNIHSASPIQWGSFSQYTVKVKARWADMPLGDEYGIVFGIRGKDNQRIINAISLYRFVVDTENNRHFALRGFDVNVDPKHWYPIVDWTKNNEAILKDTSINTLEVRCYESWVALLANSNILWIGPVNCSGEVGVTLYPDLTNIKTNAHFDDFEICGQLETRNTSSSENLIMLVPDDPEFRPKD